MENSGRSVQVSSPTQAQMPFRLCVLSACRSGSYQLTCNAIIIGSLGSPGLRMCRSGTVRVGLRDEAARRSLVFGRDENSDTLRQLELRVEATGIVAGGSRGDTTRLEHADDELRLNQ